MWFCVILRDKVLKILNKLRWALSRKNWMIKIKIWGFMRDWSFAIFEKWVTGNDLEFMVIFPMSYHVRNHWCAYWEVWQNTLKSLPLIHFIFQVPGVNHGSAGKEKTNCAHKFREMDHKKAQIGYRNVTAHICLMNVAKFVRYARRSRKFMDAYATGLNGEEAAWVVKKYRGQRVLPSQLIQIIDQKRRIHGEPTT